MFDHRGNVIPVGQKVNFLKKAILSQAEYGVSKVTETVRVDPGNLRYVERASSELGFESSDCSDEDSEADLRDLTLGSDQASTGS